MKTILGCHGCVSDSIVDHVDEVTEILFGYSKRIIGKEFELKSLAKDRGIPSNASDLVKREVKQIKTFEQKHGEGETFGYTVISYEEITKEIGLIPIDSPILQGICVCSTHLPYYSMTCIVVSSDPKVTTNNE